MQKIRHFDAFAGCGWFSQALREAIGESNIEIVWFSEIDKFAIQTYQKNFPNVRNYGDIEKINIAALPNFDLLTWGFPCQDVSVAGKQDLSKGRTILVEYLLQILETKKPEYFIFENVKGLMSKKFEDFRNSIYMRIWEAWYNLRAEILNSKDYGVPQNRERVFMIGRKVPYTWVLLYPEPIELTKTLADILEKEPDPKHRLSWKTYERLKKYESNARVYSSEGISPALNTMQWGHRQPKILQEYGYSEKATKYMYRNSEKYSNWKTRIDIYGNHPEKVCRTITANFRKWAPYNNVIIQIPRGKNKGGIHKTTSPTVTKNLFVYNNPVSEMGILRKLTPIECERLQGFPDNYTQGVSDSQRYKQLGNAVNVKNTKEVIRALLSNNPKYRWNHSS